MHNPSSKSTNILPLEPILAYYVIPSWCDWLFEDPVTVRETLSDEKNFWVIFPQMLTWGYLAAE